KLIIYDILGREVARLVNKHLTPGNYEVEFNAEGLSSGVYYYRLEAGSNSQTKKMILLR
ncbi:MAG: T9SS type A sorting domain-containing protein, partial [Melioribacteraceae bacterium]|nr:T9SS type A sorting domain-containing protein [Melioribacteraceae bacterium]